MVQGDLVKGEIRGNRGSVIGESPACDPSGADELDGPFVLFCRPVPGLSSHVSGVPFHWLPRSTGTLTARRYFGLTNTCVLNVPRTALLWHQIKYLYVQGVKNASHLPTWKYPLHSSGRTPSGSYLSATRLSLRRLSSP